MRTDPILKAVYRKKVSYSGILKCSSTYIILNLCKLFYFLLFGDTLGFMFTSSSSSVLLQYDRTQFLLTHLYHFMNEETWNELDLLATWQDLRWRRILFSFKSFYICAKNQKILISGSNLNKAQKKILHVNSFVIEIFSRKCNLLSIIIEVMYEDGQTFGLDLFSMFHKIGSCSTLYFCVVNANYFIWKQKVPCFMRISILKAKFVRKKCTL